MWRPYSAEDNVLTAAMASAVMRTPEVVAQWLQEAENYLLQSIQLSKRPYIDPAC
jgi:hypothetical protein